MKKLKITGITNQDSGVGFYRINQPLRHIGDQKLAKVHTMPFWGQHSTHLTDPEFIDYFDLESKWSDVIFSTIGSDRHYLALLMAMRDRNGCKLVIDADDDMLSVHTEPSNPAYASYLDPQGRHSEFCQYSLMQADLVTVSTEYLKERYKHLNDNIVVVKNCIDKKFFNHKSKSDDITIGYAASGTHQKDWEMVEPILKKLKKKYGVKIKMIGPMQSNIVDEQVNWVEMLKYPKELANMGFTIGIAPIRDSLMSRAKSGLRWMEYSAYKIPTVASNVVPFRGIENILLASEPEDWYAHLEKLILDKKLRTKLGQKAYNELGESYDPNYWSGKLHEAIQSLFIQGK